MNDMDDSSAPLGTPFPDDVVNGVLAHMNSDHAHDSLTICQALGNQPDATAATMTGFDDQGAVFEATVPEGVVEVRLPWDRPVNDRTDVRVAVVAMLRAAQANDA